MVPTEATEMPVQTITTAQNSRQEGFSSPSSSAAKSTKTGTVPRTIVCSEMERCERLQLEKPMSSAVSAPIGRMVVMYTRALIGSGRSTGSRVAINASTKTP
eukprot:5695805-Prymnesium_polylepis.1